MIGGGVVAQSICAAAELGIADRLAGGPQTTSQLAQAVHADEDKLYRLLRFLASMGIFQIDKEGAWSLTPLADVLRSDVPGSVRAGGRMIGAMAAVSPHLLENIRTGKCAYNLAFGKPIFEDLAAKPELAAIFDAAMNSFHGGEAEAVLDAYSHEDIRVLADLGCGSGAVMAATLQRYPRMRGILFDLPHVLERTAANIKAAGVDQRCTLQGGSFFETAPEGADAYAMRHVLHDWTDERCITILSNVRRVIPPDGRLLIIESVVPDGNEPSPSKFFDMLMMMFPDGRERTEHQFRQLLGNADFAIHSMLPTASPVSVIDARPV
jgi:SAM-dependent methyltransferase